jgi:hypothetical protein
MATTIRSAPLSGRVHDLLGRADAELLAAQYSPESWERFSHAHLAALRAAAAVVAHRGRPAGRGAPRTVWGMLERVEPALAAWGQFFADGAALRSAVEAGRFDAVDEARAESTLCAAEDFLDEARRLLESDVTGTADVERRAS